MTREHHHDQARAGGGSPAAGRTAVFLAAGVGLLFLGGWLNLRPTLRERAARGEAAQAELLCPELDDVEKAASLEVMSFDDETAMLRSFRVVRSDGVWVLPSHDNYPADAKEQMAAAATELIDRPVYGVVTDSPGDHEAMGVIEPDPRKVKIGDTGVGRLVEIRDAAGNKLARLVIGKADKKSGPGGGRPLRFVRRAGQDRVYVVELDTAKFSTKFDDWIEKDLLKLSPWDVKRVVLDDYALQPTQAPGGELAMVQDREARIELAYDDKDASWSLVRLERYGRDGKPRDERLAADEEVASAKLNALRDAVGNLKIIDVARKPADLGAELKAEGGLSGESVDALRGLGFLVSRSGDIVSANGETIIGMKDGVEYVLRFGAARMTAGGGEKDDAGAAADEPGEEERDSLDRYVLVMARFDESLLEKPKLDPVPEGPADESAGDAAGGDKPPAEGAGEDAAAKLKASEEAEAKAQAALESRRQVERENRRRQDEYDDKVKAARKRVRELNGRFADWYYIVSGKEYAKIHLDRADVVQKKPADGKGDGKGE